MLALPARTKQQEAYGLRKRNKTNDFCEKVIFSDESKYSIFGSDGCALVWRKKRVMEWGCMSAAGVGNLVFNEEIMKSSGKLKIHDNNYFQLDNDPKLTADEVKT